MPESTRLNIVERSLEDAKQRLQELPPGPKARELRAKLESYERALKAWTGSSTTDEQRALLVKLALELNVQIIALGRNGTP
jgi:hypothetical protein